MSMEQAEHRILRGDPDNRSKHGTGSDRVQLTGREYRELYNLEPPDEDTQERMMMLARLQAGSA
jgi:hypothetical protein